MEDKFTTASDVFAYGILAWEVISRGAMPFASHSQMGVVSILTKVFQGSRDPADQIQHHLPRPRRVSDWLYTELVACCWHRFRKERPSFGMLLQRIRSQRRVVRGPDAGTSTATKTCLSRETDLDSQSLPQSSSTAGRSESTGTGSPSSMFIASSSSSGSSSRSDFRTAPGLRGLGFASVHQGRRQGSNLTAAASANHHVAHALDIFTPASVAPRRPYLSAWDARDSLHVPPSSVRGSSIDGVSQPEPRPYLNSLAARQSARGSPNHTAL